MAASAVTTTHLTTISKETAAGVFVALAEVYSISGPSVTRTMTDVTHLTSPNNAKEFLPNLADWGEVTLEIAYLPGNAIMEMILGAAAGTGEFADTDFTDGVNQWRIDFNGVATYRFDFVGYVSAITPQASTDEQLKASLTIKLTGHPTTVPT